MGSIFKKESNIKFYIILAITLIIMYGFGYLPTFGQVTPTGMRILGIFLGCIFAWCFGELVWSSLLGLVTLAIFNFGSMIEIYAGAFANNTAATIVVAITFCYAIETSGLLSEFAKWIVGQKWAQKGPWGLVFAFFLAAIVLGAMATNAAPSTILLWALFYEVAREVGIKPNSPLAVIILCGIGINSFLGVAVMPYGGQTVLVRGTAEQFDPNFVFDIFQYLLMNFLVAIIYLPVVVLILRLLFGKRIRLDMPARNPYKMHLNLESKISLIFLILIVLSMLIPVFLPDGNAIKVLLNDKLTLVGIFILSSVVLMIIKVDGNPILDIPTAIAHVPWQLVLLVCSALGISNYITEENTGIVPTIISFFSPLVEGRSAFTITMIFVAIGLIMTNFINDVVTCVVLYPIAAQFIVGAGGSEMLLAILFSQVTIQGCLMPSGSVIGAMFHGNREWMNSRDIFVYVALMELVLLCVLLVVALFGGIIGG